MAKQSKANEKSVSYQVCMTTIFIYFGADNVITNYIAWTCGCGTSRICVFCSDIRVYSVTES